MRYLFKATVVKVYDGDTIGCVVDLGFNHFWGQSSHPIKFRLHGINCHEISLRTGMTQTEKDLGLLAKQYVTDQLLGKEITLESLKLQGQTGGWDRYAAIIWLDGSTVSFNDHLVDAGHAVYVAV